MNAIDADPRGLIVGCPACGQQNRLAYERLQQLPRCGKCKGELRLPGVVLEIESQEIFDALTARSALPVLVDFWAEWCGPCKMVAPELAKVAVAGAGRWIVAKVNTEHLPAVAGRLRVSAIPLLVLFRGGAEAARQAGAMPAARIQEFITQAR